MLTQTIGRVSQNNDAKRAVMFVNNPAFVIQSHVTISAPLRQYNASHLNLSNYYSYLSIPTKKGDKLTTPSPRPFLPPAPLPSIYSSNQRPPNLSFFHCFLLLSSSFSSSKMPLFLHATRSCAFLWKSLGNSAWWLCTKMAATWQRALTVLRVESNGRKKKRAWSVWQTLPFFLTMNIRGHIIGLSTLSPVLSLSHAIVFFFSSRLRVLLERNLPLYIASRHRADKSLRSICPERAGFAPCWLGHADIYRFQLTRACPRERLGFGVSTKVPRLPGSITTRPGRVSG